MDVCKNKSSGKYFIFIQEIGNSEALLVTPAPEVRSLKIDLFEDIEDIEENDFLEQGLLTEAQINKFREHQKSESNAVVDRFMFIFPDLSRDEQESILRRLGVDLEESE